MKKFAYFSDLLFAFFLSAVVTLVFFRSWGLAVPAALTLSALCGLLTAGAVGGILNVKRKHVYLKKSDETQKRKLLLHLTLLSDEAKTEFFQTALSSPDEPCNRFGRLRLFNKTDFYFLQFRFQPLTKDDVPALARLKTGKRKILLCAKIEEEALDLCRRLDIDVKTEDWVYSHLKGTPSFPTAFLGEEKNPTKKRRVKLWFAKKNAKAFLVSGSMVLLLSRITPFSYYYWLMGSILLFIAVFVRIFGYE